MILNDLHIFCQPEPAIGKSFCASLLHQFFNEQAPVPMHKIKEFNPKSVDRIFSEFFDAGQGGVLDVSASASREVVFYIKESRIKELARAENRKITEHFCFTPGRSGELLKPLLTGVWRLNKETNIVWENEGFGISIADATKNKRKRLHDFPGVGMDLRIIHLPSQSFLYSRSIAEYTISGNTLTDEIKKSSSELVHRQRLSLFKNQLFEEINDATC